jgi:lipoprotein-releasing system ATP-binding protein
VRCRYSRRLFIRRILISNVYDRLFMTIPLLTASNLVKSYAAANGDATPVLRGVSLTIERGEILAIIGASGAGKSTLLHLLGALDEADEGAVTLHIENTIYNFASLSSDTLSEVRNQHCGFIFQFHHLLPEFTALENVMMPALIAGTTQKQAREKARALLEQVGIAHRLDNKPDALSGGEQQRVAFARALVNTPAIVFADEPTGNLDSANSALLLDLMQHFRDEQGQTFVIVTHSAEIAAGADRCVRIAGGLLVE